MRNEEWSMVDAPEKTQEKGRPPIDHNTGRSAFMPIHIQKTITTGENNEQLTINNGQ
ncbi:MAG: hypothetical protein HUU02_03590 [Bacteroidetes bacterium]|nr:hypothetical protein [Bacteroidota bacterium]